MQRVLMYGQSVEELKEVIEYKTIPRDYTLLGCIKGVVYGIDEIFVNGTEVVLKSDFEPVDLDYIDFGHLSKTCMNIGGLFDVVKLIDQHTSSSKKRAIAIETTYDEMEVVKKVPIQCFDIYNEAKLVMFSSLLG